MLEDTTITEDMVTEELISRRLDFADRTWGNKLCWSIYKLNKCLYNGPYFYFFPMMTWAFAFKGIVLFNEVYTPPS